MRRPKNSSLLRNVTYVAMCLQAGWDWAPSVFVPSLRLPLPVPPHLLLPPTRHHTAHHRRLGSQFRLIEPFCALFCSSPPLLRSRWMLQLTTRNILSRNSSSSLAPISAISPCDEPMMPIYISDRNTATNPPSTVPHRDETIKGRRPIRDGLANMSKNGHYLEHKPLG